MPSLSQSPILQALGYAIAHSLWQMALVWIVYVLLNSLFKFKSEIKFRIAVAAQVIGFAWFIGTLQFYYTQCSQALRLAEAVYFESGDQSAVVYSGKSNLLSFFIKAEQVLPYLSVAYLLLLIFLTVRWFRAYRYTQIVRLNGLHKIDVDWKLFVNRVAAQLGIKQKVRIYLSELVKSPVTMGFLKPVILIPIASINNLTPQQLEAVILHELAHIKRHDYLLNIVLSIIELGLFFNPFTRLINKSISKERENSCDDWVLQYQYNPAMYAEALLRIAVMQKTPVMAMYAAKTKSELASRVHRMVGQKEKGFSYRHQLIALLLMTGILVSIAWYDPNSMKNQDVKPSAENKAVVIEPLAIKVDNPLFNPMFFLNDPLKDEVKKNIEATQKQLKKLRKAEQLATRPIELPEVMAPVAIANLKELERNINSTVNQKIRKTWSSNLAAANQGQLFSFQNPGALFKFDTLTFDKTFAVEFNQEKWSSFLDNLKASQKQIQESLKKGQISQMEAKKAQEEIGKAFEKLQTMKMPQYFGYAPVTGVSANTYNSHWLLRSDEDDDDATADKERANADEKKRDARHITTKGRKISVDSLKQRLLAKNLKGLTVNQAYGYVMSNDVPYAVGGDIVYYTPKVAGQADVKVRATATLPKTSDVATAYAYVIKDEANVEECDKANNSDRKRISIVTGRGRTQSRTVNATQPKIPNTTPTTNVKPPKTQPQTIVIEIE